MERRGEGRMGKGKDCDTTSDNTSPCNVTSSVMDLRVVLILDFWHPGVTLAERLCLNDIFAI